MSERRPRRRRGTGQRSGRPAGPVPTEARAARASLLDATPETVLRAGLMASAVAVPFAFNLTTNDVFELTKQVTQRTLIGIALVCAAALWVARSAATIDTSWLEARWRALRREPAAWTALAVLVAWLAATLASVSPTVSVWGAALRWQGLRTQLGYVTVLAVAAATLSSWERVRRFSALTSVVASLLCVYGVAQLLGLDPLPWSELSRRFPIATFGNQNYFTAYLVGAFFLTLALGLGASGRRRGVWLGCSALQGVVLLLALSRGGWLGTLAGLVVFVVLTLWRRLLTGRTVALVGGAGLMVVGVLFAVVAPLRTRLLSFLDPSSAGGTAALRLEYWPVAVQHWLARPLFGYGPDTQSAVFEWRYLRALQEEATDRAHNALLDTLMTTGAAGALALLLTGAAVVWCGWRLFRRSRDEALLAGLLAALTAHVVEQQFNLEVVAASFLAWAIAGAVFGLLRTERGATEGTAGVGGARWDLGVLPAVAGVAIALFGVPAVFWWETRPLAADAAFKEASLAGAPPAYRSAALQAATAAWSSEPELWLALGEARAEAAQAATGPALNALRDEALESAQRGADLHPASARGWGRLGAVTASLALKTGDAALGERARAAHTRATALAPDHWRNWHYFGETEFRLGGYTAARTAFDRALALYAGDAGTWAGLGNAAARTGDVATARRAFERVVAMKPNDEAARRALGAVGG